MIKCLPDNNIRSQTAKHSLRWLPMSHVQSHWVQFWASTNFTLSSPCSQVCKNCLQELAQKKKKKDFLHTHTVQFTLLSVINSHELWESSILFALSVKFIMECMRSVLYHQPRTTHMLPLFESRCICLAALVGFYLQVAMVFLLIGPSNTLLSILLTVAISTSSDLIIYHVGSSWSL